MSEELSAFPYQVQGASFLASKKVALLADEMGLGKTIQAILGLDSIHAVTGYVIAPSIARVNWYREFQKWSKIPRRYSILTKLSDTLQPDEFGIMSYEYAAHNYAKLSKVKRDALIVDESHFLKGHNTKRTKAVMGRGGLVHSVNHIWFMSGTPAPNNPSELWTMLYTFGLTKLGYDAFVDKFCMTRPTNFGKQVVGTRRSAIPELQQLLKPILLRRLKKDVMKELPPISYDTIFIEPGEVDLPIMASFEHYFTPKNRQHELEEELFRQQMVFDTLWDNLPKMNGPKLDERISVISGVFDSISTLRRYVGLQKVQGVVENVKSWFKYNPNMMNKIVIFAIHRDVIEELRRGLRELNPVVLYGGTDPDKRQRRIDKFQNNPKCKCFIGNIHAAGTAITLTAANTICFAEYDWTPGNNAQAVMRVHRIGQEEKVRVKFFSLVESLDERILAIIKRKTEDLTEIFDTNVLSGPYGSL